MTQIFAGGKPGCGTSVESRAAESSPLCHFSAAPLSFPNLRPSAKSADNSSASPQKPGVRP